MLGQGVKRVQEGSGGVNRDEECRLPKSDLVPAKIGPLLNVPAIFNVFLILRTICIEDNLADSTNSGEGKRG
jgi:hypothetical protein